MKAQLTVLAWICCNLIATLVAFRIVYWFYKDRVMLRISEHAKCPSCGHRKGQIEHIRVPLQENARPEDTRPVVMHLCKICGAKWMQAVLQPDIWQKTVKDVGK